MENVGLENEMNRKGRTSHSWFKEKLYTEQKIVMERAHIAKNQQIAKKTTQDNEPSEQPLTANQVNNH